MILLAAPHGAELAAVRLLGIAMALAGGVALGVGAQLQSEGVHGAVEGAGASLRQRVLGVLRRPRWLLGGALMGAAVVLQLGSLRFAPIVVIQPLGVAGLITSALLDARASHRRLGRRELGAIGLCVVGIAAFVATAASVTSDAAVAQSHLLLMTGVVAAILGVLLAVFLVARRRLHSLFFIVAGGLLYGSVASIAKAVIGRLAEGSFGPPSLLAIAVLAATGIFGVVCVQTAYAQNTSDAAVAGLTVLDPLVAVTLGILVLREAAGAPLWVVPVWLVSGAVAVSGVVRLARAAEGPAARARSRRSGRRATLRA